MRIAESAIWVRQHLTMSIVASLGLVACMLLLLGVSQAQAQSRSLSLYNTHTNERLTVTYKRNGRFVQNGLNQLNRFLRDWRRDEVTRMDPDLFDIVWNVYREVGATQPIHVVSAYRSPATNAMLRRRSSGVARNSQHTRGNAMDFFIPGVAASALRAAGLRQQQGGVGYYPRSNTPFVHLDTGSVRMWPRMTRSQLARVFPNGRTIHIPADGRPMSGFEQAQRDVQSGGSRRPIIATSQSAAEARNDGDGDVVLPSEGGGNLLAGLFGLGRDDASETQPAAARQAAPTAVRTQPVEVAAVPRDRYAAPSPITPPNAAGASQTDGTQFAGVAIPSPVPAPSLDELQIASLANAGQAASIAAATLPAPASLPVTQLPSRPGAISAAFAAAEAAPDIQLPPITREEQIAQTVPAPGQIAALLEARFAEQRAQEAALQAQVESSLARVEVEPAPTTTLPAPIQLSDAQPRFVPPTPQPVQLTLVAAAPPPAAPPAPAPTQLASAFASPAGTGGAAQSAIDSLASGTSVSATLAPNVPPATIPNGSGVVTGSSSSPTADTLESTTEDEDALSLAKHSIRARSTRGLFAPSNAINMTPVVLQDRGFSTDRPFRARTDRFERRDLTSTYSGLAN